MMATPKGALKGLFTDARPNAAGETPQGSLGRVLVLGGSGFIGIVALLNAGYAVTLVNRGRVYWQKDMSSLPGVSHVKADRENSKAFAEALREVTGSRPWVGVVDFSAYKPRHVEAALEGLGSHFGIYIYISTDSVYEVSDKAAWEKAEAVLEEFAQRPADAARADILARMDRYGHKKFLCEDHLKAFAVGSGRQCVALRLADVIGPYDDTHRLWAYWWWCKYSGVSPILVPEGGDSQPLNFTFSADVADVVTLLMQQSHEHPLIGAKDECFTAFNIHPFLSVAMPWSVCLQACEETLTLIELLCLASSGRRAVGKPLSLCGAQERNLVGFPLPCAMLLRRLVPGYKQQSLLTRTRRGLH
ncbi:NAD dependent epimerase dehydratase family protein [Cyclospora cayetanensis]|uniref:NAD dependent epimerase dehydratase family protein n=1 Tax=Cyclospora cayetanensis TaxID=88456 RepID=A0A1D3D381_9EIME|nr:NAD dependent epimerase dehydratase family protein [Cyclospora cayetanensis]